MEVLSEEDRRQDLELQLEDLRGEAMSETFTTLLDGERRCVAEVLDRILSCAEFPLLKPEKTFVLL